MKSFLAFASLAALSVASLAVGCSSSGDDDDDKGDGGSSSGATSNKGGEDSAPGGDTSTGATSSKGGEPGSAGETGTAGDSGTGGTGGSGGGAIASCTTGKLFAGDPFFTGDYGPVDGQALLDDPPIRNEAMAIIGTKLFIETETEIWSTDLSEKNGTLTKIAGDEDAGFVNAGVACKDTTFLTVRDMTATADGKLVVIDYIGGAVIEISDPGGPNCKSEWVAGTHVKTEDPGNDFPLAQGDVDGPGKDALFGDVGGGGGIHKVATDADGNIYTYDEGTLKFKMIATDADRTVSTIGVGEGDDNVMGLAWLKGKLYVTGVDGNNDFLRVVDPAKYDEAKPKENVTDIYRVRDHFEDVEAGHQAITSQVYADGDALIITSQGGYTWRVGTDGKILATLFGSGAYLDYEGGFDPLVAHPAAEWQLVSSLSNRDGGPWLAVDSANKSIYWAGGIGISKYAVKFDCK